MIFHRFTRFTIRRRFKRYIEQANVTSITIHDLRHSHASLLIHNNINPLVIQERLGHENIQITLNVYSHLYPDRQKEVTDLLNKISPI